MTLASHGVLDTAIDWQLRLEAGALDERDRQRFEAWLGDANHARVWRQVGEVDARFAAVDPSARAALMQRRRPHRKALRAVPMLMLALAMGLTLANRHWPLREVTADVFTATGEVRALSLPDRSRVTMHSRSAVDIEFNDTQRQLRLRHGAILVETAHGPDNRPFTVQTVHGSISPLGTRFLVTTDANGTRLTVLEAAVAAVPTGGTMQRVEAGQSLRLRQEATLQPAAASEEAWVHGMLAADNMRLADVVAELSRYQRGILAVDSRVADLRVTGSFPLHQRELALTALTQTLPIQARQRAGRWWVTLEPRS